MLCEFVMPVIVLRHGSADIWTPSVAMIVFQPPVADELVRPYADVQLTIGRLDFMPLASNINATFTQGVDVGLSNLKQMPNTLQLVPIVF